MIDQVAIGIFGIASVWLSQDPREAWRRWACVAGLCAQPFWFYATFSAGQWGIFALSFVYTAGWARGAWHLWIRPALARRP